MRDFLEIVGMLLATIIIISLLCAMATPIFVLSCKTTADKMDMPWQYNYWSGCLFQMPDGKWVADDYYIVPELP